MWGFSVDSVISSCREFAAIQQFSVDPIQRFSVDPKKSPSGGGALKKSSRDEITD
jgi:hypothetical protein